MVGWVGGGGIGVDFLEKIVDNGDVGRGVINPACFVRPLIQQWTDKTATLQKTVFRNDAIVLQ